MRVSSKTMMIFQILSVLFVAVNGYPHFPDRIPNGRNIPHPCKDGYIWYGVGHENSKGGGVRNVFGEDFAKYGYDWNKCICEADSDNDGKTNGEELGDPLCEWTVGSKPMKTSGLSHPGICEPMGSTLCQPKNTWVDCSIDTEKPCNGVDDPSVQKVTINFPRTPVPNQETTYICKAFNLTEYMPAGDFHLIATRGSIDNAYVMHHLLVYACADEFGEQVMKNFSDPVECGMATTLCSNVVGLWTIGADWFCNHNNSGMPLGTNGFKYVIIEHHWNNPELRTDYTDASGMELYITPNKKMYDSGVVFIGTPLLQIPPGWPRWEVQGGCSSDCWSRMISEPIYLTHIIPHMHYLGTSFMFEIWRSGIKIHEYTLDRYYYDNPEFVQYEQSIEVRPGDEMKLTCIYQSKTKDGYTYYGDATSAEMCFGILLYYPFTPSVVGCGTVNGYGYCNNDQAKTLVDTAACNTTSFWMLLDTYGEAIYQNCDVQGLQCSDTCKEVTQHFTTHPCYNSDTSTYIRSVFSYYGLLMSFSSCDPKPPIIPGDEPVVSPTCGTPITSSASSITFNFLFAMGYGLTVVFSQYY